MASMREAEPIKLGFLIDYIGDSASMDDHTIYLRPLELVFEAGYRSGMIDRPVEVVFRIVQGLPRGNVKAVIDAFGELVDEGCLAVIGPHISENTVAVRPEIERRFRVPGWWVGPRPQTGATGGRGTARRASSLLVTSRTSPPSARSAALRTRRARGARRAARPAP